MSKLPIVTYERGFTLTPKGVSRLSTCAALSKRAAEFFSQMRVGCL
ncbi:hypothetical protein MPNT_190005 [Candidatus Methylacidithermus pantelleriae]|uniref:Uncharacterized protein n=1 Tax=Candidatus Methylacidithermus pantelleriae TaxID=2744239 RepID=A0A8J2BL28_9BACT|nr:hypothetical protein MPNT_190005 [Candidatus Methylacidithermus pantelleriae]